MSDKTEPMHLLFVYGTLKQGERLHDRWLKGAVQVAKGYIDGFEMYVPRGWGYPIIVGGEGQIHGELYAVPQEQLARIDKLEASYLREETAFYPTTDHSRGADYPVEVYVWNSVLPASAVQIPDGVFTQASQG